MNLRILDPLSQFLTSVVENFIQFLLVSIFLKLFLYKYLMNAAAYLNGWVVDVGWFVFPLKCILLSSLRKIFNAVHLILCVLVLPKTYVVVTSCDN